MYALYHIPQYMLVYKPSAHASCSCHWSDRAQSRRDSGIYEGGDPRDGAVPGKAELFGVRGEGRTRKVSATAPLAISVRVNDIQTTDPTHGP